MTTSMPAYAKKDESEMARQMNEHFKQRGLSYLATDTGGSSHDPDITVKNALTDEHINKFESKRTGGSRTDFGQFRIYHDAENGWQFHETSKSTAITEFVFSLIKTQLDANIYGEFPCGPSLSGEQAHAFWGAYEPDRTRSVCGDVLKVPIPISTISDYYVEKGNDYIKIGKDLYSLKNKDLPTLESMTKESYAILRIKYHSSNRYSYTIAFRMKCKSSKDTNFPDALHKIY